MPTRIWSPPCTTLAAWDEAPLGIREQAVAFVSQQPFAEVSTLLASLFDPRNSQPIQLVSARSLASYSEGEVATILLRPWRGPTPSVR